MPGTLKAINAVDHLRGCRKIGDTIQRQHRTEFLAGKRMVMADGIFFDHQDARIACRDFRPTRLLGNRNGRLANHRRRQLAFGPHQLLQRFFLRGIEQHDTARMQRGECLLAHSIDDDETIFGRATGGVVKSLGAHNALRCKIDVRSLIDNAGHVTGTDTKGRRAARIRGAHIGLRAGGDHQITLAHELQGRSFADRRGQHLHQIARRADTVKLRMDKGDQPFTGRPALG